MQGVCFTTPGSFKKEKELFIRIKPFLLSLIVLINIHPAFAASSFQPEQCPSVKALKAVGVHDAVMQQSTWIAFSTNNFSTLEQWTFYFSSSQKIKDKDDAIKKGNENIGLLSLISGPDYQVEYDVWLCEYEYNGQKQAEGMAVTPPPRNVLFLLK
jgi:hypothetical protein